MFRPIRRILRSRKILALFALLLAMLILRVVWGAVVHRQLQSQLSAIRARGEPVGPSQLTYRFLPESDNAVPLYREAVNAVSVDSPRNSYLGYPDNLPRPPQWLKLAEASDKANASAFTLARSARQRPAAQFAPALADEPTLLYLGDLKSLAFTISDGAEYAHLQGNHTEAVERLLDVMHIARTLRSDDYSISYGVAMGCDALACHSIQLIAPDLPVRKVNVQPLIDELLEEKHYHENLKRIVINERIRTIRWYMNSAGGNWILGPLAQRQLLRELPNFELYMQAADATNSADAEAILDRCQWDASYGRSFSIRYSRWFYGGDDLWQWFHRRHRVLAERRLTAVSLACQLYRADHGQFPQTLDQLVPRYLPAVPPDPFFSDGRPIGYTIRTHIAPLNGPRPLLYFDPGGGDAGVRAEPLYGWYGKPRTRQVRQYRDISRFPAAVLEKTINDQPYKPYAPGYDRQIEDGSPEPDRQ